MAKRYSGNLVINVVYDDKNFYRTSVSRGGKLLWRGSVQPAPAGFGPGVAYDSPKAYDEVASSAIAFADDEVGGVSDKADYDEDLAGYLIRRTPRAPQAPRSSGKTASSHATKKQRATIAARKIGSRWQPVDSAGNIVRGDVYNADGTGYSTKEGAAEAAAMLRQSLTWRPEISYSTKIAGRDVTVEDLSSRQRQLLRDLRRAKLYHHPLSVEVSKDDVARQLASLGLLRIEPDDDLGLTWVTVTPRGRDVAIKGDLWGRR